MKALTRADKLALPYTLLPSLRPSLRPSLPTWFTSISTWSNSAYCSLPTLETTSL